jgi:hypothetical protein
MSRWSRGARGSRAAGRSSVAQLRAAGLVGRFLVAVVVLALAACASLPQSGPVRKGDPDVTEPGSIALLARLPGPDDGPEQIVDGFLRAAAAGLTDDFTVAREFLAGPVRSSWDPLARVDVYSGQPVVAPDPEVTAIDVGASVSAMLDATGRYLEADPGSQVRLRFGLTQSGGEWRISELVDGVLLSEPIFRSLFQQVPLYFVEPDGAALVSETRWFPRRTAETAAVSALLAGPSPWLAEGAGSRFPTGTRLLVDTVTVRDGVAQVGLSAEARDATPQNRALMMAQLAETLSGLPRVQAVAVTVAGAPFETADIRSDLVVDPSVGTTPVVLAGDVLSVVEGNELLPWGETERITAPAPSHPALPYGLGVPVVLSGGTAVVTVPARGGRAATLLAGDEPLTPPSFDRLGWVWTAATSGDVVHAFRVDGTRVAVDADWLSGREVRSLRISREGARALVLSAAEDGSVRLDVASVIRDAAGTPVAIGPPLHIGQRITRATTAVWVDQQTVAVLGRTAGESVADTVVLAVVGGPTSSLPSVEGAVGLAAGKGDRLLFASTAAGVLVTRNGLSWTPTVRGVRDPTFPG